MNARRTRRGLIAAATAAAVLALAGCGGDTPSGPVASDPAGTVGPTALPLTIPDPQGAAVMTLTGRIGAPNQEGAMVLDQTAVDSLGQVDLTVSDPFQKRSITYKGVWLADLLRAAGAETAAEGLKLTALDDYVVQFTMGEVQAGGMLLAVANADGSAIAVADGGPARVVFADGTAAGANSDQWIWSLATIEVR